MPGTLTSKRFKVEDLAAAVDFCYTRGWTDGLPVVPPTGGDGPEPTEEAAP